MTFPAAHAVIVLLSRIDEFRVSKCSSCILGGKVGIHPMIVVMSCGFVVFSVGGPLTGRLAGSARKSAASQSKTGSCRDRCRSRASIAGNQQHTTGMGSAAGLGHAALAAAAAVLGLRPLPYRSRRTTRLLRLRHDVRLRYQFRMQILGRLCCQDPTTFRRLRLRNEQKHSW